MQASSFRSISMLSSYLVAVCLCLLSATGWASLAPGTQLFSFNEGLLDSGTPGVDAAGNIYVSVQYNQTIAVCSGVRSTSPPPGTLLAVFRPAIPMFNTFFNDPVFVALDTSQRIYVADAALNCIIVLLHSLQPSGCSAGHTVRLHSHRQPNPLLSQWNVGRCSWKYSCTRYK